MQSKVFSRRTSDWIFSLFLALVTSVGFGCNAEEGESNAELVTNNNSRDRSWLKERVTVSGVSAGGYMAVQTHIALSDRIGGVAAIAGGPYHCAKGSLATALSQCISADTVTVDELREYAESKAADGFIADLSELTAANVWLFHSPTDNMISRPVVDALRVFYESFVSKNRVLMVDNIDTAHGWPTIDKGSECLKLSSTFINACDYDAAGELLNHLYTGLRKPAAAVEKENLFSFDLSRYRAEDSSIASSAYVFVPDFCRSSSAGCKLHLAFHGCAQGAQLVGDQFATSVGLNEWAAANNIVVVYPQIESSLVNPQGCWDWWGYTGSGYDLNTGKQVATMAAIIDAWSRDQLFQFTPDVDGSISDSDGIRVHYRIIGEGAPVVLIHGLASTAEANWRSVIPALSGKFTLVLPDLRGHGNSDKPHDADAYGPNMADDVMRLMDHLEIDRAHIVGYSMGGLVAMQLAVQHPHRVRSLIVSGQGWATNEALEAVSARSEELRAAGSALALVPDASVVREDVRDQFMQMLAANDPFALAALMDRYTELGVSKDELRESNWPLLIVMGSKDPLITRANALRRLRPDAQFVIVQGQTHLTTPISHEFVEAIDEFMSSN